MREDLEARLDHIVGELEAGRTPPTATVRELMSWIGAKNRSASNIRTVSMAFARRGLATDVVLQSADREAPITFVLAQGEVSETAASVPELMDADVTDIEEAFIDPTHKLSDLRVLRRALVSVTVNDSLDHALSAMGAHGLAYLPVMSGQHHVNGVISWKDIGTRLAHGQQGETVRDFMSTHAELVSETESLQSAVARVRQYGCVVVRGSDRRITGIVTAADLMGHLGELAEPFLRIREIEQHVRRLIGDRCSMAELRAARDDNDQGRAVNGPDDLTLGEYLQLIGDRDLWQQLDLGVMERKVVLERLEDVRKIRNRLMHFDPDGIPADDLEVLRTFSEYLLEQRKHAPRAHRRAEPDTVGGQARSAADRTDDAHGGGLIETQDRPPVSRSLAGRQRKELVFMPTIKSDSFIHLSSRGDSYALRIPEGARLRVVRGVQGCSTTDDLLARHPATHAVDVAGDGIGIENEDHYWVDRIAQANREYGVGQA
jgi:predicted transcriptional regulator